ncbi:thrombospondin type 3 repeat-containing protein [Nocardioides pacificus]
MFVATALATSALSLGLAAPAHADPVPAPYAASARGEIVSFGAISLPGLPSLADVALGEVTGSVTSSGSPRTGASAAVLGGTGLAGQLPPGLPRVTQSASAADNAAPVSDATPGGAIPGFGSVGASSTSAHARWAGDDTCLPAGTTLTSSSVTTAGVELGSITLPSLPLPLPLPQPPSLSLLSWPAGASVSETTRLVASSTPGDYDARAVESRVQGSAGSFSMFGGQLVVRLASRPELTAYADGTAPGRVTWTPPTVAATMAGQPVPIPANGAQSFALPENPLLKAEISTGSLTQQVSATAASGSASALHVKVALLGVTLLEGDIFPMSVSATAPVGGLECIDPAKVDTDKDGLMDAQEKLLGTDPKKADTDGDGHVDGAEVAAGTNPLDPKSPAPTPTDPTLPPTPPTTPGTPTIPDPPKQRDRDRDGLTDARERRLGTNPRRADTDRDGLRDGAEVKRYKTNPRKKDTDRDGMSDGREVRKGRNPLRPGR